jgi:ferredoxin
VRACELAALGVQDRVLVGSAFADPHYATRRSSVVVVAVNCAAPSGTCFCTSMGTGPQCRDGYDLVLTEVVTSDRHEFLVETGTAFGEEVAAGLPGRPAGPDDAARAASVVDAAASAMGRSLDVADLRRRLQEAPEHPQWDDVAARCLACANCTLVCPTCFCSTVVDTAGFGGEPATRRRLWDSCFGLEFSALHRNPVRDSIRARYRQWLTHKLSTWHDQFGSSGCVGCGRCITWCPAGIDLTAEATAIAAAKGVAA